MGNECDFNANLEIVRFYDDDKTRWCVEGIATTADLDVDDLYISEEALIGAENDLKKYTTLLYNHDRDKEIGKILEVKYIPEKRALWIKALISKTVPDIWQKVKEGVLSKFSVSGTALDFTEKFIKGLDKVVQYVNQIRLFETSLVTVPADNQSRTLAWYVEKSLSKQNFNKENRMSTKKKDVKKSKEDEIQKDAHSIEILISSVEDALSSDDMEIRSTALRGALDFLKAAMELSTKTDERGKEKGSDSISLDDVKKAVEEVNDATISELKETIAALATTVSDIAKAKVEEGEIEKAKAKKDEEDSAKEVEIEKAKAKKDEVSDLKRSIEELKDTIQSTLPVRKGIGAEDHKEDDRKAEAEDKTLARNAKLDEKYKNKPPADKLRAFLEGADQDEK